MDSETATWPFPCTDIKAKDGSASIASFTEVNWAALCTIMEQPDLRERFPTIRERLTRHGQVLIQQEIEKWSSQLTLDEIRELVQAYKAVA